MHYTQYRYINVLLSNLILRQIVFYPERTILLRYLKFCWIQMKIILLDHQNNFVEILKIMSNATILIFWQLVRAFYIIDSSTTLLF